jgi:hypothetical protein
MAITIIVGAWVFFAILVGYAASRRGRLAFDWFVLALLISPLLAAIILFVRPVYLPLGVVDRPLAPHATIPVSDPFLPDGVQGDIPYRLLPGGFVDAMMPGGVVRFRSMDQFIEAAGQRVRT